jgi:hypothetical protein
MMNKDGELRWVKYVANTDGNYIQAKFSSHLSRREEKHVRFLSTSPRKSPISSAKRRDLVLFDLSDHRNRIFDQVQSLNRTAER